MTVLERHKIPVMEGWWSQDGGWYEVCPPSSSAALSSHLVKPGGGRAPFVRLVFKDDNGTEDVEVKDLRFRIRESGRQVEDEECCMLEEGTKVLALHEDPTSFTSAYLDAVIVKKEARAHTTSEAGETTCMCAFTVSWLPPPQGVENFAPPMDAIVGVASICLLVSAVNNIDPVERWMRALLDDAPRSHKAKPCRLQQPTPPVSPGNEPASSLRHLQQEPQEPLDSPASLEAADTLMAITRAPPPRGLRSNDPAPLRLPTKRAQALLSVAYMRMQCDFQPSTSEPPLLVASGKRSLEHGEDGTSSSMRQRCHADLLSAPNNSPLVPGKRCAMSTGSVDSEGGALHNIALGLDDTGPFSMTRLRRAPQLMILPYGAASGQVSTKYTPRPLDASVEWTIVPSHAGLGPAPVPRAIGTSVSGALAHSTANRGGELGVLCERFNDPPAHTPQKPASPVAPLAPLSLTPLDAAAPLAAVPPLIASNGVGEAAVAQRLLAPRGVDLSIGKVCTLRMPVQFEMSVSTMAALAARHYRGAIQLDEPKRQAMVRSLVTLAMHYSRSTVLAGVVAAISGHLGQESLVLHLLASPHAAAASSPMPAAQLCAAVCEALQV